MPAGELRVEGARELRRSLRAAGDTLTGMKAAHRGAATIAADAIREEAPEGPPPLHLKNTIRPAGTNAAAIVRAGNNTSVRYAGPIVYGWGRRNIAANPFMSRGARRSEPRWIRVYEDYLQHAINQIEGI